MFIFILFALLSNVFRVKYDSPLKNSSTIPSQMFKSGDSVDFYISTDDLPSEARFYPDTWGQIIFQ